MPICPVEILVDMVWISSGHLHTLVEVLWISGVHLHGRYFGGDISGERGSLALYTFW